MAFRDVFEFTAGLYEVFMFSEEYGSQQKERHLIAFTKGAMFSIHFQLKSVRKIQKKLSVIYPEKYRELQSLS